MDGFGNFTGCISHRIIGQMRIAACGLHVRMSENGPNDRERIAPRQADGGKAMPQIMKPKLRKARRHADLAPYLFNPLKMTFAGRGRKNIIRALNTRDAGKDFDGRRAQRNNLRSRLGVPKREIAAL